VPQFPILDLNNNSSHNLSPPSKVLKQQLLNLTPLFFSSSTNPQQLFESPTKTANRLDQQLRLGSPTRRKLLGSPSSWIANRLSPTRLSSIRLANFDSPATTTGTQCDENNSIIFNRGEVSSFHLSPLLSAACLELQVSFGLPVTQVRQVRIFHRPSPLFLRFAGFRLAAEGVPILIRKFPSLLLLSG